MIATSCSPPALAESLDIPVASDGPGTEERSDAEAPRVSGPREDDGTGSELIVTAAKGPGEECSATVTFTSEADEAMDATEKHCSQRNPVGDVWMKANRMPHSVQKDGM